MLHHLFDLLGPPRVEQPIERLLQPHLPLNATKYKNWKSRPSSLDTSLISENSETEKKDSKSNTTRIKQSNSGTKKTKIKSRNKKLVITKTKSNDCVNSRDLDENYFSTCESVSCEERKTNTEIDKSDRNYSSFSNCITTSRLDDEYNSKSSNEGCKMTTEDIRTQISDSQLKSLMKYSDYRNHQPRSSIVARRHSTGLIRYPSISNRTYRTQLGLRGARKVLQCSHMQNSSSSISGNRSRSCIDFGESTPKYSISRPVVSSESRGNACRTEEESPRIPVSSRDSGCKLGMKRRKSQSSSSCDESRVNYFYHQRSEGGSLYNPMKVAEEVAVDTFVPVAFNSTFQRLRQQLLGVDLGKVDTLTIVGKHHI